MNVTASTIEGLTDEERAALQRFVGDSDLTTVTLAAVTVQGVAIPDIVNGAVVRSGS